MCLEFLPFPQIMLLLIKSVMITNVGVILMKISFQFRLWARGKYSTEARVKMKFIPSVFTKLLNSLCLLKFVTMLLSPLFSIKHFGIWGLVILTIKFSNFFFLISSLYWISILIWIILVHIVCMVECIIFLFENLSLLHLLLLNLYTLMCGVLPLCNQ